MYRWGVELEDKTGVTVQNWFGDLEQEPHVVVTARTVDDILSVMLDPVSYPGPVRAIGSNHSTTRCGIADGGTVVDVSEMTGIVEIGEETVTAQAGALYIDVAHELEKVGLQFFVNIELGNLTMGSAATGGTKDASMPGEFGQVCSYATQIKLVTSSGELLVVDEDDGELMTVMLSSYGLLGIIYEVTFRVRPLRALSMRHRTYTLDAFLSALPALKEEGDSMMLYLFPFVDRVAVEFRRYQKDMTVESHWQWWLRNTFWSKINPGVSRAVSQYIPGRRVRSVLINLSNRINVIMLRFLRGSRTSPADQMIRYPHKAGFSSYTFSIWAFDEARYPAILRDYFDFCLSYYDEHGYRCDMLNVGYRISKDRNQLFSYTWDFDVMTLDPVSTGQEGWDEFLVAYNEFCSEAGGIPLFNQTKHITPAQAHRAFGDRLATFDTYRRRYDPTDRLLNEYFRTVLSQENLIE